MKNILVPPLFLIFITLSCAGQQKINSQDTKTQTSTNTSQEEIYKLIDMLSSTIEKNATDRKLYMQRAMLYFSVNEYNNSISDFDKVIEEGNASANLAQAHFFKALANLSMGITDCDNLVKAKLLGYEAEWDIFKRICPNL